MTVPITSGHRNHLAARHVLAGLVQQGARTQLSHHTVDFSFVEGYGIGLTGKPTEACCIRGSDHNFGAVFRSNHEKPGIPFGAILDGCAVTAWRV